MLKTHNLVNSFAGVYGFCIDNTFSRFSAKLVYFYLVTYVVAEWELFTQELQKLIFPLKTQL